MNECINKKCKKEHDKVKQELIIEVAKLANAVEKFKTIDDIEIYYEKYAKFQDKKVSKDFNECSARYCKKFNKFQQTEIKKTIDIFITFINSNIKMKPSYYDDLINAINKLIVKTNSNKDDNIFKLTYYMLILTLMTK